jgi:exo-beta-1,3-glucanase (GH17 family)
MCDTPNPTISNGLQTALDAIISTGPDNLGCIAFGGRVMRNASPDITDYHNWWPVRDLLSAIRYNTTFRCLGLYPEEVNPATEHYTLQAARDLGFKVIIPVNVVTASEAESYYSSVASTIDSYAGTIIAASCGNEYGFYSRNYEFLRMQSEGAQIDAEVDVCLTTLKRKLTIPIPVGVIDTPDALIDSRFYTPLRRLRNADWVGLDYYAFYDNNLWEINGSTDKATRECLRNPPSAADLVLDKYKRVQCAYPSKKVILTETGWPGAPAGMSNSYFCANDGSNANKVLVAQSTITLFRNNGLPAIMFEAFNEAAKRYEGAHEEFFGVFTDHTASNPKFF